MTTRIEALRSILQASPNDCFVRYGLAQEHVKAGDDAAALDELARILEIDSTYQAAYYHAGKAYQRLGRIAEARAIFERGVQVSIAGGNAHARSELEAALAELPPADNSASR
jgi:Tfp pilus assembly protein PilF